MRYALILVLLFEPIMIDEVTYNAILQSSRQNMRGLEYDMLTNMLNQLEQKAVNDAKQKQDK
jgi:hypothetical protein